jgi:hypothetical protein
MTSQEMTERLFKEAKIATTPMVGWGDNRLLSKLKIQAQSCTNQLVD